MKKFVLIITILSLVLIAVSCGPSVENSEGSAGVGMSWDDSLPDGVSRNAGGDWVDKSGAIVRSAHDDSSSSKAESKKRIIIWADPNDDSAKAAVKNFEKKRPDVEMKLENSSTTNIEAIQRAMSSGQAPDIMRLDHVYITSFGRDGNMLDLNKYGAKNIAPKFVDSCWNAVSHNGATYGIPGDANTIAFMYNIDMLNNAGKTVDDLKTYEGLKDTARAMKDAAPSKTPITFPFFDNANFGRGWDGAFNYLFWLWSEGGEVLSPDLKTAVFNQQPGVDSLNKLISFSTEKLTQNQYMEAGFYRGEVGMIQMGCWAIPSLISNSHGQSLGATTMPVLKKGIPGYSGLGLYAWGVTTNEAKTNKPRSEEKNQACFDFLEFFCTDDALQVSWARKNNFLPTTKGAVANSYFTSSPVWSVFAKQFQITKSRPGVKNWMMIEGLMSKAIDEAVSTKDTKKALDAAAARVNELLKNPL